MFSDVDILICADTSGSIGKRFEEASRSSLKFQNINAERNWKKDSKAKEKFFNDFLCPFAKKVDIGVVASSLLRGFCSAASSCFSFPFFSFLLFFYFSFFFQISANPSLIKRCVGSPVPRVPRFFGKRCPN